MTAKYLNGLAFCWFIGTATCLIIEGSWFGSSQASIINSLSVYRVAELFGTWKIPVPNIDFLLVGLPRLLTWDYSFLQGGLDIIQWFLAVVLGIGVLWGLYQLAVGVISLTRR